MLEERNAEEPTPEEPADDDEWVEYVPIRAEVELTEADYVEAHTAYAAKRGQVSGTRKTLAVIIALILVGVVRAWPPTPGVWTLTLVACVAGLFLVRWQWVWFGRRAFRELAPIRRRYTVTVDHEAVHSVGPKADVRYGWPLVHGWIESAGVFVLYGADGVLDLIPRRAIADGDLDELRALFEDCVEPPAAPAAAVSTPRRGRAVKTVLLWLVLVATFVAVYQLLSR